LFEGGGFALQATPPKTAAENNMLFKQYYAEFVDYKQKQGHAEHTLGEYRHFLGGSLSHCCVMDKEVMDLRLTDVADVIQAGGVHGEFGPQRSVSLFRQLLRYLEEKGEKIPFNWMLIKLPPVPEKEQDFLIPEEFEDFVNQIDTNTLYGLRDRALYELLWSTGLRIGEALKLNRDCYLNRETKIKNAKGGDEAKVYFSERSVRWIDEYLKRREDTCAALFVVYQLGIRRLKGCQARKNLLTYRQKFGIEKRITHHAFRRSFCSLLLDKGATIKEVQYLARHKSERTTLRFYCKVQKEKVKEVHQRIFNAELTPAPALL
jgi:site-specific recombinase XerD